MTGHDPDICEIGANEIPRTGLHACSLEFRIDGRILFPAVEFHAGPGEIVSLMGPSGVGKSTLLAFLSGVLSPGVTASGRVFLDGEDITQRPPENRRIGLLLQDAALFPHLSVEQNLGFGLSRRFRGEARRKAIADALEKAGLPGFEKRDPGTLSGGERARVALFRALLAEPRAILLDEPFSRLDTDLRAQIRRFVFDAIAGSGLPAILVTHDAADAEAAGGPVITLQGVNGPERPG